MLGGVVEYVAEDLLHAFAVGDDGRQVVRALVAQLDALPAEDLAVGEDGVLQLGEQVGLLHAQGEAPVLHPGEVQQLLDHGGQTAGLLDDDVEAALRLLRIRAGIGGERFRPAVDGGERRAQLMRDGGDELLLDLLGLRDLERHIVDVVHQLAELVAIVVVDQDAVAAGGDAPRGVGHDGDRLDDVVDEDGVGEDGKAHAQQRNADGDRHADEHAAVRLVQRGDVAQHADHAAVEPERCGDGEDPLPRLRVKALEARRLSGGDGLGHIARSRLRAGGQAVARHLHAAVDVDELKLEPVLFLKGLRRDGGVAEILAVALEAVARKIVGGDAGAGLKARAHGAVVGPAHAEGVDRDDGDDHQNDGQHGIHEPALAQAADAQAALCGHGGHFLSASNLFCLLSPCSTCSPCPRRWRCSAAPARRPRSSAAGGGC